MELTFANMRQAWLSAKDPTRGKAYDRRSRADVRLISWYNGYGIRVYNTVIAYVRPNGDVVLNDGGFRTVTTREWMNEILSQMPFAKKRLVQVVQRNFEWYIEMCDRSGPKAGVRKTIPYDRFIVISKRGFVCGVDSDYEEPKPTCASKGSSKAST